jgi:hypothetical protein
MAPSSPLVVKMVGMERRQLSWQRGIRVGGSRDGSYLVSNDLTGIGYCLSPGINNFKHFEDGLSSRFDITCDMYDASSDADKLSTPLILGKQTFEKNGLTSMAKQTVFPSNNG